MTDRIKQRLDVDWHTLLDALNETYEAAYTSLCKALPASQRPDAVTLHIVEWTDGLQMRVGLLAHMSREKNDATE